ncbi:hypothetical protein EB093_05755 [bacterium]|nr:hypothetical protein [bacterium]
MSSLLGYQFSVILTLGGLCSILYLVLRYTKSMQTKKFSGAMRVVDRLPIDTGATLIIIELHNQQLLLSVSGKETRLLKEWSNETIH